MKLLIIASEFPPGPGGIGTHAWQIGTQLVASGWEVAAVTQQDYATDEEVGAFNARSAIRVIRVRHLAGAPLEAIYRYLRIRALLGSWRPDVILATGERSVWLAALLARVRGTPWIAVGHGTEFGTTRSWERSLSRNAFTRANAIVCVSEYTRSRMHAAGIRGRREVVIPNGADPEIFKPSARSEPAKEQTMQTILTAGNVTERKGQEIVIRALPRLPGVRYEVVGLPTRARELQSLAKDLGVADRVEFTGRVTEEELVRRMNACDLFVMTSVNTAGGDFEGYGIAVVEAALCGKPAVVSSGSGLAEAILPGETGLVALEADPVGTAAVIRELLDNDPRRRRMGAAARERALAEQTWARRAAAYDKVLRDVLKPAGRKLVVVSDTPHYRRGGVIVGWGPTVRELDHLSRLFDELVHVAPVSEEIPPTTALPYESPRIRVREIKPAGGDRLEDKLQVLANAPGYLLAALEEMIAAQVIHLRCPASVSMLVAMVLPLLKRPATRWIKYAGNWDPQSEEPWTYEVQRKWLMRPWHRAVVTVNGSWSGSPRHVHPFLNPSLTDRELSEGRAAAERKKLSYPVRLLFVGRLEEIKGAFRALLILASLKRMGLAVAMDIVGDGPERPAFERLAEELRVAPMITMHGWLARTAIGSVYERAHLSLLPSASEGWPKVLSEGMAYGVVPVAGRVSSIAETLLRFGVGTVADPYDVESFTRSIAAYVNDPPRWAREAKKAVTAATEFSYTNYEREVSALLGLTPMPLSGVGQ